ncbi:hypothetical protein C1645_805971 [Glomus cerebriforme]|uniref:RZ-type domain-containing protein n=1 Tax=Glomus cerebriforme TaxID=658196 RepID=A0A397SYA4_9GLOM|nr:hypothetical protein C1645_805971 [Glomus cerebriforme]
MNRNFDPNNGSSDNGRIGRIYSNRGGSRMVGNNEARTSFRGGRGGGGGRRRGNNRQDDAGGNHRNNTPPKLSVPEIKQSQQETTIANFSSSELSYKGSDRIVFITNGETIISIWKRLLKKEPWNQHDIKIFISSALIVTDSQTGYKIDELVSELGKPEGGLKRLKEIINFPSMSCDAGLNDTVLSFQYVILPFLGLLTRTAITDCNSEKNAHAIYTAIYTSLDSFLYNKVMKMLTTLVQRNSVVDREVSVERLLSRERYSFIPSSLGIFFLIIVRLLTELLRRIKAASINETMHKIANDLQQLKTTYQQSIGQQQLSSTSTDPLINDLNTREYFFMILDKEMETMNKMLNNGRNNLIFEQQNPNAKELNSKLTQLHYKELARKVDAKRTYDPPGELSKNGKRHDNDFIEISEISIIPTREEILCDRLPFLPSSLPDAPHFLPDGVRRLLDTQFRLVREDMLNPIRGGISNFLTALLKDWSPSNNNNNNNKLSMELKRIQEKGGRFKYNNGITDNGDLQVYTHIQFIRIDCDRRKGFSCTLRFTPPSFRNSQNPRGRKEYWEKSKKLLTGSLVAILLPNPNSIRSQSSNSANSSNNIMSISKSDLYSIYFGVISSRDEISLSRYEDFAEINISFIDTSIYPVALNEISNFDKITKQSLEKRFMVESTGVYLEAYYHILKTLQTTNPSSLPFEKYLAPNLEDLNKDEDEKGKGIFSIVSKVLQNFTGSSSSKSVNVKDVKVDNPMYTRAPGFEFDLSVLFKDEKQSLKLNVANICTHDEVAKYINENSIIGKSSNGTPYGLDETQAKALISALTREIALIEGPPGTGKTVVGIQIMKVLLARENRKKTKLGPILTICFTNHALDQFLEHLLDENIDKIVRLGSRTKSERIKKLVLDRVSCRSKDAFNLRQSLKEVEEQIDEMTNIFSRRWMTWNDIREHLRINNKRFYNKFNYVTYNDLPSWVIGTNGKKDLDGFETVQKKQKKKSSIFEKWVKGDDIIAINKRKEMFLNLRNNKKKNDKKGTNKNTYDVLKENLAEDNEMYSDDDESQFDYETMEWIENYNESKTDRSLDELLKNYSIWKMSKIERLKLHDYWRTSIYQKFERKISDLQKKYELERQEMDNIYDEERRRKLINMDVIGMTTNGAAKFQGLIKSIGPKIIICEEAGEVLEAHILSALSPDTQHLILIGDHNQLRPGVATYSLSMDSKVGKNYQLDQSLFERLVRGDKAVEIEKTQLLTQRRMREKEISDLIRNTLYPNLEDGDNTAKYDNIRGAQHNVYFIDHRHPEDSSGGDFALQSHVNRYEVSMVVEMVKYFVRNGYTKPDDIAVLTPYLGQMMKIRDALAKSFVVVIDERDEQDIAEIEEEREGGGNDNVIDENIGVASTKSLNQQVTLRTVDNFQGEEASIVIISLVRNFSKSGDRDTIGFLKSSNRSNVLLSRAREGMYLIGNSELMASKSKDMWEPVIDILRKRDPPQVGFGMPIVCDRHPNYKHIITEPQQFEQFSPDGGCHEKCDIPLPCGHSCTKKCHSDNPKHVGVACYKPCLKLHPGCNHPCPKLCSQDCGNCEFSVGDIILPGCGHVFQDAKCWQDQTKEKLRCNFPIDITLPCGHVFQDAKCWQDQTKEKLRCNFPIDITLPCGHVFQDAKCWQDQTKEKLRCNFPIDITLPCGHTLQNVACWKIQTEETIQCNYLIGDIILSDCGHTLQNVKCWQNQNKETLKCTELVTRKLPSCEHFKVINCTESVDKVNCREKCRKQLNCGHECLNECFKCQEHSTRHRREEETDIIIPIERTRHGKCKGTCNKLLFCGHLCREICHEGGECPPCRNRCAISCEHKTCRKRCIEPCAVCPEKCLWECKHRGKCELSCGVPCSRLPCNVRCDKKLECGHRCAGVCGEICPSKDFCVECAPEKVTSQVSDRIINIMFGEIDWNRERMIVLSCRHVYTMKTMDTLMEMENYYEGSIEGRWTSVKILPTLPMNIKTCPTCQTPVKGIRRYGRIIKNYTLVTQNKKFLLKYDYQLKEINQQITSFVSKMKTTRSDLKQDLPRSGSVPKELVFKEHNIIMKELPEITPYYYFENIAIYHGFDEDSEQVWIFHVKKLLKRYQELTSIIRVTKKPPHKKAFETAVIYAKENSEEDLISDLSNLHISDSSSSNSIPPKSLQLTSTSQIDRRIYLDTFLEIINIQKILYHEILTIIKELPKESRPLAIKDEGVMSIKEAWKNFAERIQLSIQRHLYTIREVAESTHYGRHLLLVSIEILEFDLKMLTYQLKNPRNGSFVDRALQARMIRKCEDIKKRTAEITKSYKHISAEEPESDIYTRLETLWENCNKVETCAENWHSNIEEKLEIHQAMTTNFKSSGHWYECPKGHPYTIEECDKVQMNRCPDCNVEEIINGNQECD